MKKGSFVISLDFELLWGVRDHRDIDDYGRNVENVWTVIPRLLEVFEKFNVSATFAVVGMLFFSDKDELFDNIPTLKPTYHNGNLSPYNGHFELLNDTNNYKYHFAPELIASLKENNQEIGTHTFSHYYCLEPGQTEEQFEEDILAYLNVTRGKGFQTRSIIFPRNQYGMDYLAVCAKHEIQCYRGNERHWAYNKTHSKVKELVQRAVRLVDRYLNVTGHHCHDLEHINDKDSGIVNIPSSRFLAPYNKKLSVFEKARLKRITKSMSYAAQHGLMYHLWWHPHNYGNNIDENFSFLEEILAHYKHLSETFEFENLTMGQLCEKI